VVSFRARAMDPLHVLKTKPRRLVAGLMSGTSADGIDCAICSIEGGGPARDPRDGAPRPPARVKLEAFRGHPYDASLRRRILGIAGAQVREIAALHAEIGDAFAEACLRTLVLAGIPEEALDLVGSHGQTIYHHNGTEPRVTLQIGDGDRIAEKLGTVVVSDFRARDVAAGGEGAPLTPYADLVLLASAAEGGRRPVVLNLGGIANVTILDPDPRRIAAFDTGPANAPLDRLARLVTGGEWNCDFGGKLASEGRVVPALLEDLLRDPFLARKPPKSTGTEAYGDAFVARLVARHGRADRDLLATATAFVARSIAAALRDHTPAGPPISEVIAAGGGTLNPTLLTQLKEALAPIPVVLSDERGIPSKAREAMAFAILGNDALLGLPTNLPQATGAARHVTLGKMSFPPSQTRLGS